MIIENSRGEIGKVLLDTENGDIIAGNGNKLSGKQTWFPMKRIMMDLADRSAEANYTINKVWAMSGNCEGASLIRRGKPIWEIQPISIQLNKEYTAIIDGDQIKVGCQTFDIAKIRELIKIVDETLNK